MTFVNRCKLLNLGQSVDPKPTINFIGLAILMQTFIHSSFLSQKPCLSWRSLVTTERMKKVFPYNCKKVSFVLSDDCKVVLFSLLIVVENVKMLEKQFSNMQRRLLSEMKTNSEVSPDTLVDSLTLLPISLRAEYQKFVFENLRTLEKAESIREIFHHLNLHFTFIDYQLLEYLIEEYGSHRLKKDMSAYTKRVQIFKDETTIQQLMDHWPGRHDIPPHFEELRAVVGEDPSKYTLQQLDNLRKKMCSVTMLSETILILIGVGKKSSFIVHYPLSFFPG